MTITVEDTIESKLKLWRQQNPDVEPTYIILGREAYFFLKEALNIPPYDEIPDYRGWMIHIRPAAGDDVWFL
jgi:hypothetical protein